MKKDVADVPPSAPPDTQGDESGRANDADRQPVVLHMPVDVRSASLAVVAVLAVIFVLHWAQAFFIPIMIGLMLSYALSPVADWLEKGRVPRVIGAAILLVIAMGGVGAIGYSLSDQAAAMIETLPQAAQKFRLLMDRQRGTGTSAIGKVQKAASELQKAATDSSPPETSPPETAPKTSPSKTGPPKSSPPEVKLVQMEPAKINVRDFIWTGTTGALAAAAQAVLVIFLAYFLIVSGDTFRRKLVQISGPTFTEKKITVKVLDDISANVQRFMLIQLFTTALVGVTSWLGFAWLGLEHAAVWGIAAAALNMIPYIGALAMAGATALAGFVQFGTIGMALAVASVTLVVRGVEGFLLTPWLTGKASQMSPVVVFVAVLFWGWLWGGWGLLLGMPMTMMVKAVCDHVEGLKHIGELLGS